MNLSNLNPNLPQIPANYGPSSQNVHNYVTHHINSSPQNNQSQQPNTAVTSSLQTQQSNVYITSQQSQRTEHTPSSTQQFNWTQYPTTSLGTGITDLIQQPRSTYAPTATTNTHSTPNSYTAEYYGNDDTQQSLGFGAMSVNSSVINQPHSLHAQAASSTIQSALNNLNSSQLGIGSTASLVAAPPIPVNTVPKHKRNRSTSSENMNIKDKLTINDKNAVNLSNISNMTNLSENNKPLSSNVSVNVTKPDTNPQNIVSTNANNNFYLAPGSANHGGSYRQTLNPAIYNAYRMSSATGANGRNNSSIGVPVTGHRINSNKSPIVHVIAETVYRIPSSFGPLGAGAIGIGLNGRMAFRKQDRFDKTALYKTELCTNWMLTGACTYGNKCHFAHGVEDLKPRMRVENYKTQPCCDPAREGCRRCMYGRRCNYCHPGEAIRRPHPTPYYDKDYYNALRRDFGIDNEFPFGIYV